MKGSSQEDISLGPCLLVLYISNNPSIETHPFTNILSSFIHSLTHYRYFRSPLSVKTMAIGKQEQRHSCTTTTHIVVILEFERQEQFEAPHVSMGNGDCLILKPCSCR